MKRGEIYYVEPSKQYQETGSEQRSNRPAIIVSNDLISRQSAIDACKHAWAKGLEPSQYIEILPSAQPELLSDAYTKAVWTWLIGYQIKAAQLKGRYTPYEVLSWVLNDWRKEHERSD